MRLITILIACSGLLACSVKDTSLKSVADYRAEATAMVTAINAGNSLPLVNDDAVVFVDVREAGELADKGKIEGAVHIPRGVLEFHIDPASGMHNEIFSGDKQIVFYCASGGRSVLAARLAMDMGVKNAAHLEGGFAAWAEAGGAIQLSTKPD